MKLSDIYDAHPIGAYNNINRYSSQLVTWAIKRGHIDLRDQYAAHYYFCHRAAADLAKRANLKTF